MTSNVVIVSGGQVEGLAELVGQSQQGKKVIGVDRGALRLIDAGLDCHVAIGDFDSISSKELEKINDCVETVIILPAEKDMTDTEAALDYVVKYYPDAQIKMVGLLGGRLDHLMSNLWIAYHPSYQQLLAQITIVDSRNSLSYYRPGRYHILKEKDKKYLSLVGMTSVKQLVIKDAKYPLTGHDFSFPIALVSNEFLGEQMTFSFEEGLIALIQSND